ncbi:MAG TPA: hypothetical protein ENG28_02655 [Deltaproteobacteria bacterium]|nr:MAG: hypothetical protein DRG37_03800 [Deltaproteobacteria bacterium]HDM32663.1 hypothetical protein [Deltaproteobacteria bacterium]
MEGTIKELLKIPGVRGYAIVTPKKMRIKFPLEYKSRELKDRFRELYNDIMGGGKDTVDIVEVCMEDMDITMFVNKDLVFMVVSNKIANNTLLRMMGRLISAKLVKG